MGLCNVAEWLIKNAPRWVVDAVHQQRMADQRSGIIMAAEVASDYDYLSGHDHLVSDCILGKLNVRQRKPRKNRTRASDYKRLSEIAEILEAVDNRCMAVDGPVSLTKDEITSEELRRIYRLAKGLRGRPRR